METTRAYKIKCPLGIHYSAGGRSVKWTKSGKMWANLTALKLHLRTVDCGVYDDCTIEEFDVIVTKVKETNVHELPLFLKQCFYENKKTEKKAGWMCHNCTSPMICQSSIGCVQNV